MRRASCVFRRGCGPEGSLELEKSAVCHDCIDGHIVRLRWQRVDDFFVKHHRNNRDAVVADLLKRTDIDKEDPDQVAADFLKEEGLD